MASHVHTHGVHHGAALSRLRQYRAFFSALYARGTVIRDLSRADISLDDEDVRYTTDAAPGVHDKLAVLDCLHTCSRKDPASPVSFWDLYAAPGMDVLYCMLLACSGFPMRVTATSIVRDEHDEARFRRMEHNVASVRAELPPGTCEVSLLRSSALAFCRSYAGPRPDAVNLSMPWMTSMGELEPGASGQLRSAADMMREGNELLSALRPECRPRVILLMFPYGPGDVKLAGYAIWESIFNHKHHADTGEEISSYYTHILRASTAANHNGAKQPSKGVITFKYYVG